MKKISATLQFLFIVLILPLGLFNCDKGEIKESTQPQRYINLKGCKNYTMWVEATKKMEVEITLVNQTKNEEVWKKPISVEKGSPSNVLVDLTDKGRYTLEDGEYNIIIRSKTNPTNEVTYQVAVDNIPPPITITTEPRPDPNTGRVTLRSPNTTITVMVETELNAKEVTLYNTQVIGNPQVIGGPKDTGEASNSVTFDNVNLHQGENRIYVKAEDLAGNPAQSNTITVVVVDGGVTIIYPHNGDTFRPGNESLVVRGTAPPEAEVTVHVNERETSDSANRDGTFRIPVTLNLGENRIYAEANGQSSAHITVYLINDVDQPPTIWVRGTQQTVETPYTPYTYEIPLSLEVRDDRSIDRATINGQQLDRVIINGQQSNFQPGRRSLPLQIPIQHFTRLHNEFEAFDSSGQSATLQINFQIPPELRVNPQSNRLVKKPLEQKIISGSVTGRSQNIQLDVLRSGQSLLPQPQAIPPDGSFNIPVSLQNEREYQIRIVLKFGVDILDGFERDITIIVDGTPPTIQAPEEVNIDEQRSFNANITDGMTSIRSTRFGNDSLDITSDRTPDPDPKTRNISISVEGRQLGSYDIVAEDEAGNPGIRSVNLVHRPLPQIRITSPDVSPSTTPQIEIKVAVEPYQDGITIFIQNQSLRLDDKEEARLNEDRMFTAQVQLAPGPNDIDVTGQYGNRPLEAKHTIVSYFLPSPIRVPGITPEERQLLTNLDTQIRNRQYDGALGTLNQARGQPQIRNALFFLCEGKIEYHRIATPTNAQQIRLSTTEDRDNIIKDCDKIIFDFKQAFGYKTEVGNDQIYVYNTLYYLVAAHFMRLRLSRIAELHRSQREMYMKYIRETEDGIRTYEEFIRGVNRETLGFAPAEVGSMRQELSIYRSLAP